MNAYWPVMTPAEADALRRLVEQQLQQPFGEPA